MENWKRNLIICWLGSFATSSALSQVAPILPLFIQKLGVHSLPDIETWSGIAFGSTTFIMAFFSPFWGKLADKYGRKPMLLRASLGMSIVVGSISLVSSVYQLVGLRMLMGTISGFNSGAITLIATQTPENKAGWALGTLSTGSVSGMLLGPLIGGYLVEILGIRKVFIVMGLLLLIAFLLTLFFVREDFIPTRKNLLSFSAIWRSLANKSLIISMFITTFIVQVALFSIEPVITVYIGTLTPHTEHLAFISGMVFASSGLSSILAAPWLGKLSDHIGAHKVILAALICAAILFIPQAFVQNEWQLMGLRFLVGIATGAMLPSINTILRQNIPSEIAGRIFSYNQTAQFLGVFCGSVFGGQIAAYFGIRNLFFSTSLLLFINVIGVREFIYKKADQKFSHNIYSH
ncbi:multidrug efflux MFS transporter [Pectinatus frisingensis]|jgi:MFS family permease|uniref:multidrug efflux MFS transporter n=1 Tax=Pectinatus frisingensis TaxID=865 RepID=UPI0015F5C852|nr:multidrug efflux MFS transporter [Pectinatus frisingensis]